MKNILEKIGFLVVLLMSFSLLSACAGLQKPQASAMTTCPNCGMILKKWAHTNHEFTNSEGRFRTCSIHCLADMSKKSGEKPKDVRVALHLSPEKMIPAEKAFYVIGSSASGTMTMVSKLAFASRAEAEKFSTEKGGKKIGGFSDAFAAATKELAKAKPMIQAKRKKMGKIVEPSDQDRCVVCNMFPARYPKNNAQLLTPDKKRFHFCSTQCLFEFLQDPQKYAPGANNVGPIWVHDHASGRYIFGRNAYYVVGSKVLGPMGSEAIVFDIKSEAMGFVRKNGGNLLRFKEVRPAKIRTK